MAYASLRTIINIAARTIAPPMRTFTVSVSPPKITANKAAKTTSIVIITATFVADICACDQVWITNAIAVQIIAV
jgi:hypothetical protein